MWDEKAIELLGDEITDVLDNNDITVISVDQRPEDRGGNGMYEFELEFYSPEGEDFIFDIVAFGKEDFIQSFREYAKDFDPDEHASVYIDMRGKRGVPDDIRSLIDDANAIKEFLETVACELEGEENVRDTMTVEFTLVRDEIIALADKLEISPNELTKDDVVSEFQSYINDIVEKQITAEYKQEIQAKKVDFMEKYAYMETEPLKTDEHIDYGGSPEFKKLSVKEEVKQMTKEEKDSLVYAVEMCRDYGDPISDRDFALFCEIIDQREKEAKHKNTVERD